MASDIIYNHNSCFKIKPAYLYLSDNGCIIDDVGAEFYHNAEGYLHRENGPAIIFHKPNQTVLYLQNGIYHRIDGPAVITHFGTTNWYYEGEIIKCSSLKEFTIRIKNRLLW